MKGRVVSHPPENFLLVPFYVLDNFNVLRGHDVQDLGVLVSVFEQRVQLKLVLLVILPQRRL